MTVLRFDPFTADLDTVTRQLLGAGLGTTRAPRFMPVDLFKTGDHYVLLADLPGVDPGSVDVNVDNGTLTLTAERTSRNDDDVQWLSSERFSGTYRRQLSLGDGIDTDKISATYENGVLTVTIPVAERAKARRIEVAHAASGAQPQPTIESTVSEGTGSTS